MELVLYDQILLNATSSSEILSRLIDAKKSSNARFSMANLCKRAGISSRGYLSDVIAGRRVLAEKYIQPVSAVFGLSILESKFLAAMIKAERSTKERPLKANAEIEKLKKLLNATKRSAPQGDFWLAFNICGGLDYFNRPVSLAELQSFFPHLQPTILRSSLELLVQSKIVEKKKDDQFILVENYNVFQQSPDLKSTIRFFTRTSQESIRYLSKIKKLPDPQGTFHSMIFNVDPDGFEKRLREFVTEFLILEEKLVEKKGKLLVQVNLMVHPSPLV